MRALQKAVLPRDFMRNLVVTRLAELDRITKSRITQALVAPQIKDILPKLPDYTRQLSELAGSAARAFKRAWEEAMPPNWLGLETDEMDAALTVMRETGFCLVWAPRQEIVKEIVQAEPADRATVVLDRRNDILDDLKAVLDGVSDARLALAREVAEEAIAVACDGRFKTAQAASGVVFTDVIHANLGMKTRKAVKLFEEKDPDDAFIREFRLRAIFVTAARALDKYYPVPNKPPRREFNRHSTLHRITPEQYTELNAIAGLMLAVALLREIQDWLPAEGNGPDGDGNAAGRGV